MPPELVYATRRLIRCTLRETTEYHEYHTRFYGVCCRRDRRHYVIFRFHAVTDGYCRLYVIYYDFHLLLDFLRRFDLLSLLIV